MDKRPLRLTPRSSSDERSARMPLGVLLSELMDIHRTRGARYKNLQNAYANDKGGSTFFSVGLLIALASIEINSISRVTIQAMQRWNIKDNIVEYRRLRYSTCVMK